MFRLYNERCAHIAREAVGFLHVVGQVLKHVGADDFLGRAQVVVASLVSLAVSNTMLGASNRMEKPTVMAPFSSLETVNLSVVPKRLSPAENDGFCPFASCCTTKLPQLESNVRSCSTVSAMA